MAWSVEGCRAKLARFEENLASLDRENGRYIEAKPNAIVPKFDPETGWHTINLSVVKPPGLIFGVLIGEAAHNLRCALDYLAWQLANLDGPPPKPKRVQFPICSKGQKGDLAKRSEVSGMRAEHVTVLEGFQPYMTERTRPGEGNTYLEVLAEINDTDKHRLVHAVSCRAEDVVPDNLTPYPGYKLQKAEFPIGRVVLEGETEIGRVLITPPSPDLQMYVKDELSYGVAFGERGSSFYGFAADGLLRQIQGVVEDIIAVFDRPGLSGQPPWPS